MYPPRITIERAKALRRRMTLPEVVLWQALRGRRLGGVRVRRQHPVGPYILDFFCPDARLAIEVDGSGHEHPDQARHDDRRTDWLTRRGITVWRVPARYVLENLDGVLAGLEDRVCGRPPPPLRGPPPPMGEEWCVPNPPPSGEVARSEAERRRGPDADAVPDGGHPAHDLQTRNARLAPSTPAQARGGPLLGPAPPDLRRPPTGKE